MLSYQNELSKRGEIKNKYLTLRYLYVLFVSSLLIGCAESSSLIGKVEIEDVELPGESKVVGVALEKLSFLADLPSVEIKSAQKDIAYQYVDANGDGTIDHLLLELPQTINSSLTISVFKANGDKKNAVKKTQAELWHKVTGKFKDGRYVGGGNFYRFDSLRVPDDFMDHAYFIKYEGPGWESDKVGYRLYLDWRNAIDVYGKRTDAMVLQDVGLDGYESYHHLQDWGMDILKVGNSLGIGTTAWWDGSKAVRVETTDSVICRIPSDGNLQSQVQIWYYGWKQGAEKVDLMSLKSINAGSHMTHEQLYFNKSTKNICTGIRKDKKSKLIQLDGPKGKWNCIATWGDQSLNNDAVGLAVLYPVNQNPVLEEDGLNYVVRFDAPFDFIQYYFLATWELENQAISSEEMFREYLMKELDQLENSITITIQ